MNDRARSRLTLRTGRHLSGAARVLALLVTATASAVAAETPVDVKADAAPSATPTPTPAPATSTTTKPSDDDDDGDDARAPAATPRTAPASEPAPVVIAPDATLHLPVPMPTPVTASAPAEPDLNRSDDGRMGSHQEHWLLGVGVRELFVTGKGYDPFSTDNVLPQLSLNLGRAFAVSGPFSFAGMFDWDFGSTKASARGTDMQLSVHRLSVGAEGRYHLLRRLYVFGRVAPGALHSGATFHDEVLAVDREANAWVFTTDFSLGAAFEFAGDARGASNRPRAWFGVDGGYSYASSSKLDFDTVASGQGSTPARLASLSLGDLAVRGAFFRLAATVSY